MLEVLEILIRYSFIRTSLTGAALKNTSLSLSLDTWHDNERVFNMIGLTTGADVDNHIP